MTIQDKAKNMLRYFAPGDYMFDVCRRVSHSEHPGHNDALFVRRAWDARNQKRLI